jgi:hypothetical protein
MDSSGPPAKRHDLTQLTPLEANKIITHYIQSVNPSLKLEEPEPIIRYHGMDNDGPQVANDRHHVANDVFDSPGLLGPAIEILAAVPPDYSGLGPKDFVTHFSANYRGMPIDLRILALTITAYAAASVGNADLTSDDLELLRPALERGWETLAHAKKNGSAHVRNMARELEHALKEFYEPLPGQRFLPTSNQGSLYER